MADAAVSETSSSVVENQSSFIGKEGRLLKKGKFLNSWHECTLKLEKDCIAYKKIDKKVIFRKQTSSPQYYFSLNKVNT